MRQQQFTIKYSIFDKCYTNIYIILSQMLYTYLHNIVTDVIFVKLIDKMVNADRQISPSFLLIH